MSFITWFSFNKSQKNNSVILLTSFCVWQIFKDTPRWFEESANGTEIVSPWRRQKGSRLEQLRESWLGDVRAVFSDRKVFPAETHQRDILYLWDVLDLVFVLSEIAFQELLHDL